MGQYTQSIVTIVGTVVGTYFGYPALGTAIGSLVGSALQPNSKAAGPRIDDLKAPAFAYGSAIPRIRGRYRTAGCYIWASEKREIATTTEQGGKGGPGVDVTEFTYEMDVLIMLTDDMLAAVPRVFSNGELVYNALAGSSAATIVGTARNSLWREMRVYTGAADQLPDPVYEQAVGVGNAPAYRGRGTVFLEGLQLGQTGQVPLLTFEVLTSSQEVFSAPEYGPQQAVVSYFPIGTPAIDTGVLRVHVGQWDNNYASSLVYVYDIDVMQGTSEVVGSYVTGTDSAWGVGQGNTDVDCFVLSKSGDLLRLYRTETGLLSEYFAPDNIGQSQVRYSIRDNDFIVGSNGVGTKALHRFSVVGGLGYAHASSSPLPEYVEDILIHGGYAYAVDKANGHSVYVLDRTTLALLDTIPTPLQGSGYTSQYVRLLEFRGDVAIWLPTASPPNGEHSIHRLVGDAWEHVGDMPDATDFLPGVAGGGAIGFIGNLLISGQAPTGGGNVYVTQTATLLQEPGTLDLADEVIALAAQCGIAPGDVDASDLVGIEVDGYAITQVSPVRTALEVLATAYYFECVESDRLAFRLRGGAPVATLAFERLGAAADEASEDDPLDITRGNDSEVPARVSLAYVNFDNDYQSGSVDSDRLIGVSDETRAIQLPVVMQPAKAKGIANTAVMDGRVAATTFRPAIAVATAPELEPTDVVLLTDEEGTRFRARIVRETLSGPVRQFECVLDDASVLQDVGITYEGTTPSMDVLPPADTDLLLLDIPILRDEDDYPGLYAAGKSRGGRWPGYSVHRSDDDVNYENVGTATRQAVTGFCATTLGDWTGGNVFDEQNSVTVTVGSGELSSYSRDDILDGVAPGYVVGAELLYARTATLNAPGNYTLTGLLRGRRGTEWAQVDHGPAERFAVLANNGLLKTSLSAALIGTEFYYRGVTNGRPLSSAVPLQKVDSGVAVKPFAPVDLRPYGVGLFIDGITWKRRTRLETAWVGANPVTPLGEASELYDVEVYSGATLIYTGSVTEPTFDLSAAIGLEASTIYAEGIAWPFESGASVFGLQVEGIGSRYLIKQPATGGALEQTSPALGDTVNDVVYVGGYAYVSSHTLLPGGFIDESWLRRIALSDITTVATTWQPPIAGTDVGKLVYDGANLWSGGSTFSMIRRHDLTTLAVLEEVPVPYSGYVVALGAGNGMVYVGSSSFNSAFSVAAIDPYGSPMTFIWSRPAVGVSVRYGMLVVGELIFVPVEDGVDVLDAINGALLQQYADGFVVRSSSTGSGLGLFGSEVVYKRNGGGFRFLDVLTGAITRDDIDLAGADFVAGDIDGELVTAGSPTGSYTDYQGQRFGSSSATPDLSVTVYQVSETVGRGYPASIDLT